MLDVIEKLLILQDRDRKILKLQDELARIGPERQGLQQRLGATTTALEAAKHKARQTESDRKKLELDVEAKKQQIERYSLQQFQTKKNEEYKALTHEIEACKQAITQLEDQQLVLMEKAESDAREIATATAAANEARKTVDARVADLNAGEAGLQKELAGLQSNRGDLAAAVEEGTLSRYERLLKQKGQNVVVGIQHGVCGGCHMQLSRSVIVLCQGEQEVVTCPNCARILYYTRDMDMAVAD
ncbi:MAG: hypothetical protein RJA22_1160 [Verrucomicrobiota bacterium]